MKSVEINARLAFDFWPGDAIHRNGDVVTHKGKKVDYRDSKITQRLIYALKEVSISVREEKVTVNGCVAPTLAEATALAYLKGKNVQLKTNH